MSKDVRIIPQITNVTGVVVEQDVTVGIATATSVNVLAVLMTTTITAALTNLTRQNYNTWKSVRYYV
jgi:hypothetical protein